jgi:glycosyltransferase involved in cell wall biosynthesis
LPGVGRETPLVSVIVPCRDHARELRRCLAALESQRVAGGFEIVVVDSGADEEVAAVAKSFASTVLVRGAGGLLPGEARNLGAEHARGTHLCFIDADCTPEPGWLEEAMQTLRGGAKMVGGAVLDGDPWHPVASLDNLLQFAELAAGRPAGPARLLPTCNLALRRSDFQQCGGFPRTGFPAGEDTLFCNRASELWGERLRFVPSMRVRHFGRTGLREFAAHQDLFGYVRALYELELRPIYLRLGRFALFAPAVVAKRLSYLVRRTVEWDLRGLLRLTLLLPLLLYGLAAWSNGFRRGCRDRARIPEGGDTRPERHRDSIALDPEQTAIEGNDRRVGRHGE